MEEKIRQTRLAVYIDGSNLYHKLKSLAVANLSLFDYRGFVNWLAVDRAVVFCGYYVGLVRAKAASEIGQRLRQGQQQLFAHLRSPEQRILVKTGYIMQTGNSYYEKGVDVQIAVDILVGAYENSYDVVLLISSDTDLLPSIQKVKQLGKKVEYIGFGHSPSHALVAQANLSRLLIKQEVEQFAKIYKK